MSYCKVMLTTGEILFDCKVQKTFFEKLLGLMFSREIPSMPLFFDDAWWMHSFFCFVNFHIVFLDKNFNVIKSFFNVEPNKILPPVFGAKYAIEYFGETVNLNTKEPLRVVFYE